MAKFQLDKLESSRLYEKFSQAFLKKIGRVVDIIEIQKLKLKIAIENLLHVIKKDIYIFLSKPPLYHIGLVLYGYSGTPYYLTAYTFPRMTID